jgi:hypothetical protein
MQTMRGHGHKSLSENVAAGIFFRQTPSIWVAFADRATHGFGKSGSGENTLLNPPLVCLSSAL